jgi:CRP/FNR family cyclic AMP-dependent transcriptional regulator
MELIELLKTIELFEGLSDTQLQRVAEISKPITVNKDEIIFSQGDEGDRLYIVRDGQVVVQVGDDLESARSQVFLGRGQIFGEMALIDLGPRSATMVCTRDGTVLHTIAREALTNLCEADSAIGYVVMRNMVYDLSFKLRHSNLTVP